MICETYILAIDLKVGLLIYGYLSFPAGDNIWKHIFINKDSYLGNLSTQQQKNTQSKVQKQEKFMQV